MDLLYRYDGINLRNYVNVIGINPKYYVHRRYYNPSDRDEDVQYMYNWLGAPEKKRVKKSLLNSN